MKLSFSKMVVAVSLMALFAITTEAKAGLIKRTNNLIYDDVANVTWVADMKYSKTIGDDSDGKMAWTEANDWAGGLDTLGSSDWRLPTLEEGLSFKSSYADHSDWFAHVSKWSGIWTATEVSTNDNRAYRFQLSGSMGNSLKTSQQYVWTVIDGDVPAALVPEPTSLALFSLALIGLAYRKKQQAK